MIYSIENEGSDSAKILKLTIKDWEISLDGWLQFQYVKDVSFVDIEIEFKKR